MFKIHCMHIRNFERIYKYTMKKKEERKEKVEEEEEEKEKKNPESAIHLCCWIVFLLQSSFLQCALKEWSNVFHSSQVHLANVQLISFLKGKICAPPAKYG